MVRMETIAKGITLYPGDCMAIMQTLDADSVDSCVTDPPYHFTSIVKRFGADDAAPAKTGVYERGSRGFMGKQWDGGEIAFEPETWAAVYRVLKPGGHLLAFGAPKNFGFMQYAIAQAGFEIRDVLAWLFGSGFPKSHNQPGGLGTALKPAYEPIIMARKPLIGTVAENIAQHGTGAINIDGCRVGTETRINASAPRAERNGFVKGFVSGTETENKDYGRWPANVVHDGSEEVVAAFPDSAGQQGDIRGTEPSVPAKGDVIYGFRDRVPVSARGDEGSAARFFYTAKADSDDRLGSKHPTVKPLDLMQWLVRLVTPKGGLVLDPFAGTGISTSACAPIAATTNCKT